MKASRSRSMILDDVIVPEQDIYDPIEAPKDGIYAAFSHGLLRVADDGVHFFSGQWAYSKTECQNNNNMNSIQFKLEESEARKCAEELKNSGVKRLESECLFPVDSANYKGSFKIKGPRSNKMQTIVDEQIVLKFRLNAKGFYNIYGKGVNACYGTFDLVGTMILRGNNSGLVNLFRTYLSERKGPIRKMSCIESRSPNSIPIGGSAHSTKTHCPSSTHIPPHQQRKSSRNVKPPLYREYCDPEVKLIRIMDLCNKILKQLCARDQLAGSYFAIPVDPIALGIPYYGTIITDPMDLGTIQVKMDSKELTSPYEFSRLVRLVFENAIAFNVDATHYVHQSARDLLTFFNKQFRDVERLIQQVGITGTEVKELNTTMNKDTKRMKEMNTTKRMKQIKNQEIEKRKRGRGYEPFSLLTSALLKLQKTLTLQMTTHPGIVGSEDVSGSESFLMKDAIHTLCNQMSQVEHIINGKQSTSKDTEISQDIQFKSTKGFADFGHTKKRKKTQQRLSPVPFGNAPIAQEEKALTLPEKEALIEAVEDLSQEHAESVIRIIQHAKPDLADKTEIDIEVDLLDTATQRKIQKFISSVSHNMFFFTEEFTFEHSF